MNVCEAWSTAPHKIGVISIGLSGSCHMDICLFHLLVTFASRISKFSAQVENEYVIDYWYVSFFRSVVNKYAKIVLELSVLLGCYFYIYGRNLRTAIYFRTLFIFII